MEENKKETTGRTPADEQLEKDVEKSLEKKFNRFGPDSDTVVVAAADTITETMALKKEKVGNLKDSAVIDIDKAKWQRRYAEQLDSNFERLVKLGLYDKLIAEGIVQDPTKHMIVVDGEDDGWEEITSSTPVRQKEK